MQSFMTVVLAALLIESIVNIVENIKEKETNWKYWASLIIGIVISILVAINWNIDLFLLAGFVDGRFPLLGPVLTGIIISRGSNVVSDLIGLINR